MLSVINLEAGMPTVDVALRRLTAAIHANRAQRIQAFKIIHGYGSSGTGGRIRTESRRYLDGCARSNKIKYYIPGESFSIFDEKTRKLLDCCPAAKNDSDLEKYNNGITVIVL